MRASLDSLGDAFSAAARELTGVALGASELRGAPDGVGRKREEKKQRKFVYITFIDNTSEKPLDHASLQLKGRRHQAVVQTKVGRPIILPAINHGSIINSSRRLRFV